ncbi:Flp family type IVb pilin [Actinacidiphila guanduensis]|jgi:Flp pilus assembly pilin Flp|nr:hypothetical protein [Actinacidiphila guanduensis]
MNRWLLHRYTATEIWLRAQTDRLTDRLTTSTRGDRGQTSFEYLGIAVVIAVIIGVLAGTTDIGDKIKNAITRTINKITNAG